MTLKIIQNYVGSKQVEMKDLIKLGIDCSCIQVGYKGGPLSNA